VTIIGSAETRTSILHPARGMIRYAIRISNDEPNAHIVCTGQRSNVLPTFLLLCSTLSQTYSVHV